MVHVGKPYALVGYVRFDKGVAMQIVTLFALYLLKCLTLFIINIILTLNQTKLSDKCIGGKINEFRI